METKENRITVVACNPGKTAEIIQIGSTLEEMQKFVGGYIEAVYPFEEQVCIVCNEEAKINGMDLNRALYDPEGQIYDIVAGPCFICDCRGENFGALSPQQQEKYLQRFKEPEMFFRVGNDIKAVKLQTEVRGADKAARRTRGHRHYSYI